jgi:hypothetical protein
MASFEWKMKLSPQNSKFKGQYTNGYVEYEVAAATKTQAALDRVARGIEGRAKANLQRHHKTGASHIELYRGSIDRFIALEDDDPKSPAAAMIEIETGALTEAAKLPRMKKRGT